MFQYVQIQQIPSLVTNNMSTVRLHYISESDRLIINIKYLHDNYNM